MTILDINENNSDVPLLAEFLYKRYPYDAIDFEIDSIKTMITFLPELYYKKGYLERERMFQILIL
jgi:hypothetical protein